MTVETHTLRNRGFDAHEFARPVLSLVEIGERPDLPALVAAARDQSVLECSCGEVCPGVIAANDWLSVGAAFGVLGTAVLYEAAAANAERAGESRDRPLHVRLQQGETEILRDDRGRVSGTREKEGKGT